MSRLPNSTATYLIPRLAIVDDAEFDQMLYARMIKRTGLIGETLCFYNVEDALAYFAEPEARAVDVVLLDINMPGLSGFDFLENASDVDTIVVMLTTSQDPSDVRRANQYAQVKDYIVKPLEVAHIYRIADLLSALKKESKGT